MERVCEFLTYLHCVTASHERFFNSATRSLMLIYLYLAKSAA